MEFMLQYNCKIIYVKGAENCAADALSQTSFDAKSAASAPYPPDGSHPITLIYNSDDTSFVCTHILTDPVTITAAPLPIAATFLIAVNEELLAPIRTGYTDDPWCKHLKDAPFFPHGIKEVDGLLYVGDQLIILQNSNVHELLFHLAHNILGHFGFSKSYRSLHNSFYWSNLH